MISYDYLLGSGMDCKGRPFLQKFLEELSPLYEIVVFSNFNDSHVIKINLFSKLKIYKLLFFKNLSKLN